MFLATETGNAQGIPLKNFEKTKLYNTTNITSDGNSTIEPQNTVEQDKKNGFYLVHTNQGDKWVQESSVAKGQPESINEEVTITHSTLLYQQPYNGNIIGSLDPQIVKASQKWGDWYEIATSIGNAWIRISYKIQLNVRTPYYKTSAISQNPIGYLNPQELLVIGENKKFYQISSTIGAVWLPKNYTPLVSSKVYQDIYVNKRTPLYKEDSTSSQILGYITPQKVKSFEKVGNFYHISSSLGAVWIDSSYTNTDTASSSSTTTYIQTTAPMHKSNSESSSVVGYVAPQTVKVIGWNNGWVQIQSWLGPVWISPKFLPPPVQSTQSTTYIQTTAPMHKSNSESSSVVGYVAPQTVKVIGWNNGWVQIQSWLGPVWISPKYLQTQTPPVSSPSNVTSIYIPNTAPMYSSNSESSSIVEYLAPQTVKVIGWNNGWAQIQSWLGPVWINPKYLPDYPQAGTTQVAGIKNQVVMYSGDTNGSTYNLTKNDFKPYVSYIDTAGNRKDIMFDSFLFMPFATRNNGDSMTESGTPSTVDDWNSYMDNIFTQDQQLSALDQEVTSAKSDLGNSSYKAKVFIAIPYPRHEQTSFGNIDGSGNSIDLSDNENRKRVVDWYIDQVTAKWNVQGYKNLQLAGFYWIAETVTKDTTKDEQLIQATSQYLHFKGYKFEWIPYYLAYDYYMWKTLGFDMASFQPNYEWSNGTNGKRLTEVAGYASTFNASIETELSYTAFSDTDAKTRYYQYLDIGKQSGLMNSYKVFYQDTDDLAFAALSTNPDYREIYDKTYQYLKGSY